MSPCPRRRDSLWFARGRRGVTYCRISRPRRLFGSELDLALYWEEESIMNEAVIVGAVRTPIGKFNGSLASLSAPELGSLVIGETLE